MLRFCLSAAASALAAALPAQHAPDGSISGNAAPPFTFESRWDGSIPAAGAPRATFGCVAQNRGVTENDRARWRASTTFAHRVIAPADLTVTGASFFCRSVSGQPQTLSTALFLDASGRPAATASRTGMMTAGTRSDWYSTAFQPIAIRKNQVFYIAYTTPPNTAFAVTATTGVQRTPYFWRGTGWSGPWRTVWRFAWRVECSTGPKTGDYRLYGNSCTGTGKAACPTLNPNTSQTPGGRWGAQAWFSHRVRAVSDMLVNGCEFRCRSSAGQQTLTIAFFRHDPARGEPAPNPAATGQMVVGTTTGSYGGNFTPQLVKAGETFYIAYFTPPNTNFHPSLSSGETGAYYWKRSSWSGPWPHVAWSWRVRCTLGTPTLPTLVHTGFPQVGKSFEVALRNARANTAAVLLLGGSRTTWLGLPLPLSLAPFGAPACSVFASGEIQLGGPTDAQGERRVTITLPNNPSLRCGKFFNQFVIVDPGANNVGLVTTNAGDGLIGG